MQKKTREKREKTNKNKKQLESSSMSSVDRTMVKGVAMRVLLQQ